MQMSIINEKAAFLASLQKGLHSTTSLFSCVQLLRPHGVPPTRIFCPRDFPGKNTGMGCHFLLQGIFLTQGPSLRLLHWQADPLPPSDQESHHVATLQHNYPDWTPQAPFRETALLSASAEGVTTACFRKWSGFVETWPLIPTSMLSTQLIRPEVDTRPEGVIPSGSITCEVIWYKRNSAQTQKALMNQASQTLSP